MRTQRKSLTPYLVNILKYLKEKDSCTIVDIRPLNNCLYWEAKEQLLKLRKKGYVRYADTSSRTFKFELNPEASDLIDAIIHHYGYLTESLS